MVSDFKPGSDFSDLTILSDKRQKKSQLKFYISKFPLSRKKKSNFFYQLKPQIKLFNQLIPLNILKVVKYWDKKEGMSEIEFL